MGDLTRFTRLRSQPIETYQARLTRRSRGESIGLRLEGIESEAGTDRTEQMATVKRTIRGLIEGIGSSVSTIEEASRQLLAVSERLDAMAGEVASATEEMSANVREIATRSTEASSVSGRAVDLSQVAADSIQKLGESSREIANVTQLIRKIASECARGDRVGQRGEVLRDQSRGALRATARAGRPVPAVRLITRARRSRSAR